MEVDKQDLDFKMDENESENKDQEKKLKEQNRIRQLAFKAREKMPKDFNTFMKVATHLLKNAHRYHASDDVKVLKMDESFKGEIDNGVECKNDVSRDTEIMCKEVNKKLREIKALKSQNRIREQQGMVSKLKEEYGSYRDISRVAGVALKMVHGWCSEPKERIYQSTACADLRKEELTNFLMQDTVTFSHPSKKYSDKKFLLNTWEEIYKKYRNQPEFHENGLISKTTMRVYKPKYVLLSGATPVNQCLCDICENCELIRKAIVAAGVKQLPSNKYQSLDSSFCDI